MINIKDEDWAELCANSSDKFVELGHFTKIEDAINAQRWALISKHKSMSAIAYDAANDHYYFVDWYLTCHAALIDSRGVGLIKAICEEVRRQQYVVVDKLMIMRNIHTPCADVATASLADYRTYHLHDAMREHRWHDAITDLNQMIEDGDELIQSIAILLRAKTVIAHHFICNQLNHIATHRAFALHFGMLDGYRLLHQSTTV